MSVKTTHESSFDGIHVIFLKNDYNVNSLNNLPYIGNKLLACKNVTC